MSIFNRRALASSIDENILLRATLPHSKPTLISFPKELGFSATSKSNLKLKTTSIPINIDFVEEAGNRGRRSSFLPDDLRKDSNYSRASAVSDFGQRRSSCIMPAEVTLGTAFVMGQRPKEEQKKTMTKFCTGSKYIGEWNPLGMAGKGIYKFPHGVLYDGYFNKKGEFHGSGMLIYPNGQRIEGFWRNGKLSGSPSFVTRDNNVMCDTYCRMPDRRFQIELEQDFNCAGEEYLTNARNPPRNIPAGCYDAGEGFYNPNEKAIFSYKESAESQRTDITKEFERYIDRDRLKSYHALMKDETALAQLSKVKLKSSSFFTKRLTVDIVHEVKEKWILENCRKAWDEPTGYNPKLYEDWTTGTKTDTRMKNLATKAQDEEAYKIQMADISGYGHTEFDRYSKVFSLMYSFIQTHNIQDSDGGGLREDPLKREEDENNSEESQESLHALSMMFIPTMQSPMTKKLKKLNALESSIDEKHLAKERHKKLKFKLRKIVLRRKSTLIKTDGENKLLKIGIKKKKKNRSPNSSIDRVVKNISSA